jgi:cobalt/nickel transport protein
MRVRKIGFVLAGLLVAFVVGVLLSPFASSFPDGLERVAEDKGFIERAVELRFPFLVPDYTFPGINNEKLATSLAGLVGVAVTFGVTVLIGRAIAKRDSK